MSPDDPAVADIVRRAMVARIATLSRNGRVHINPLYFIYKDRHIYLGTSDRTLAAWNVRANSRVTILFNVERKPEDSRVVRIRGHATLRTDRDLHQTYVRGVVKKYFMNWGGLWNTIAHAGLLRVMHRYHTSGYKGEGCVLEVVPDDAEFC
jgi:general stress protein 26